MDYINKNAYKIAINTYINIKLIQKKYLFSPRNEVQNDVYNMIIN